MNREMSANFQSTFGESPVARASRIDNILQRNIVKKPEISPQSASFLTRIIDRAASILPSKKAVALLSSVSMLVAACGDTTTETTLPPTTSITIETTIPTTTLPPTTTEPTLPPSTTVPETTTTTIPPIPVEPTGEVTRIIEDENGIRVENMPLAKIIKVEDFDDFKNIYWYGIALDMYETEEAFGDNNYLSTHIIVSMPDINNNPVLFDINIGRKDYELKFIEQHLTDSEINSGTIITGFFHPLSDLYSEIERRVRYNSQIGFIFPDPNDLESFLQSYYGFLQCYSENPSFVYKSIKNVFPQVCEGEQAIRNNIDQLRNFYKVLNGEIEPDINFSNSSVWMTGIILSPISNLDHRTPFDFDFSP